MYLENYQEEICEYCEDFIIEGCSISQMFICEGRFCEEACQQYLDHNEIWVDINEYENIYQISNWGNVKSLSRSIVKKGYSFISKEIILKPSTDKRGYKRVGLYKNNKINMQLVSRLVAQAFLDYDLTNKKLVVDHINNDKGNNNVDNLQIITQRANCIKEIIKTKTSSKYIGVTWGKKSKRWHSLITINNKSIYLGCFKKEIDAHNTYQKALKNTE